MTRINFIRLGFVIGIGIALFFGLSSVSANTLAETTAGYGYTQEYGGSVSSRVWVAFNSSNLVKYNYQLPNSSAIDIDEFNIRMRVSGGFSRGSNYIITFKWANYDPDDSVFLLYYNRMIHSLSCYASSWSSTAESGTSCFTSYNISATEGSTSAHVLVTVSITPSKDFYGLVLRNYHDNDPYSSYVSEGWELYDFDYVFSESGTSEIINNATQNTQNIINNQNSNTQNIIDNQNSNTQAIIDSNKSCEIIDVNDVIFQNKALYQVTGETYTSTGNGVTDYYNVKYATLQLLARSGVRGCFYDKNKSFISCLNTINLELDSYITIPDNAVYFRTTIELSNDKPKYKLCKNSSQAVADSITDDTPPDTNSLSNAAGWLPAGPVDSILNLPLTLLQSLNNTLSTNSCQPLSINLPHLRTPLVIPCMTAIWEGFGLLSFFTWVGRVLGGILLYKYLVNLYKWVDDTLTLREKNNFDDGSLG